LAHFFGVRWQARRDVALLATFAFAGHQSGDTSKLAACLIDPPLSREADPDIDFETRYASGRDKRRRLLPLWAHRLLGKTL
jgi:hypothetical protein